MCLVAGGLPPSVPCAFCYISLLPSLPGLPAAYAFLLHLNLCELGHAFCHPCLLLLCIPNLLPGTGILCLPRHGVCDLLVLLFHSFTFLPTIPVASLSSSAYRYGVVSHCHHVCVADPHLLYTTQVTLRLVPYVPQFLPTTGAARSPFLLPTTSFL